MSPKQIEDAIVIKETPATREHPWVEVSASIALSSVARVSVEEVESSRGDVIQYQKARLKEQILRMIFEDQRRQVHEAIMGFATAEPFSAKLNEQRERLMALARRGGVEL
jgi:hypothetical protein